MLFDLYWRLLGLPLSRFKGVITDAIPFSLVEISLWIGTATTLLLAASFLWPRLRGARRAAFVAGPVFLIALGLGQGAFPLSIAPTALREPLPKRLGADSLDEASFRAWVAEREARLTRNLSGPGGDSNWRAFQALPETTVLRACDREFDTVLPALGLLAGRTVRGFKNMGPWTAAIGTVYGGPAFHDPFFGEAAVIRYRDYPTSHYWRLIAACHETAHAKGFTREMDAEILTQLALMRLAARGDARYESLADLHFLLKTGTKIAWPESLKAEALRERDARLRVEASRPLLARARAWARRNNLQNSPVKYGERGRGEAWNPRHPFFATVRRAWKKAGMGHNSDGT